MRNFEQQKRDILDRVDIVDLISAHVQLKRSGRRLVGLCPFHSEKTPSFTVVPDLGIFKCFGCGKGGDIFSFVQYRENVSFPEALAMLADRAGVTLERTPRASKGPSRAELARVCAWGQQYFRHRLLDERIGASARAYLRDRGFDEATLERFGVGLAPDDPGALARAAERAGIAPALLIEADLLRTGEDGRTYDTFRNRIVFPIRDSMKRVLGFGGRTLADDRAKYLNTRQNALFDKGRVLFGVDLARPAISDRGRAIVVEGYTDCLALHQCGYTETVATLGTALTQAHVDLLRRYADEVVLLFDSDEAGQAAADRAIRVALPRGVRVRLARITDGKDPGDLLSQSDPSAFTDVLNGTVDALEFKWLATQRRYRGDASDARRREAVLDFLRLVGEAAGREAVDVIQRGLMVNQCAHLLGMDRADVDRLMRRFERGDPPASATTPTRGGDRGEGTGALDRAWVRLFEVTLNEPALWSRVAERLHHTDAPDEEHRRIARWIEAAWRSGGRRLTDVLALCDDPAYAERLCAWAEAGAERGNYEATLHETLSRIERLERERMMEASRNRWLNRGDRTEQDATTGEDTDRIRQGLQEHRHFAPRRLLRSVTTVRKPDES